MSLLEEAYEPYTIINKSVIDDGYGGTQVVWTDGAQIMGAMVFNNSNEAQIAQALGAKGLYTLTVKKNIELDYYTVLRRESDGKIFRLTANSDDKKTPSSAYLNMRQYTAEEYTLPIS